MEGLQVDNNISLHYASGLTIEQSTNILISNIIVLTVISNETHTSEFGLLAYRSSRVVVDSFQAYNFSWGVAACRSITIGIHNAMIQNSDRSEVLIFDSHNLSVANVISQSNEHGILLVSSNHTHILSSNCTLLMQQQSEWNYTDGHVN